MKSLIPLEKDIQNAICEYLTLKGHFFWRQNNIPVFGTNNAGHRTFRSLPKYTPKGIPDIIVVKEGKFIAIEVKRQGAILTPEQVEFRRKVVEAGGDYYVCYSVVDVQDFL